MFMTSVSEGFAIVREVGSPHVRVLYDFYHEQRAAGNTLKKARLDAFQMQASVRGL
jgi:hydroxypyruvate isomerase